MRRVCCLIVAALITLGAARGQGMTQPEGVRALVNGVGALSAAAVLTAVRSAETGSFTLAGRVIPFTLASAGIFAALQWGFDQAKIAAGSSLDQWNKYGGQGVYDICLYHYDFSRQIGRMLPNGTASAFYPNGDMEGAKAAYAQGERGGGTWSEVYDCPFGNPTDNTSRFWLYRSPAAGKPSLADWIAGTYTPSAGQTAVPHPEAAVQLRELVKQKIVADNPQSSDDAAGLGIGIYPPVPPVQWHAGVPSCPSGSIFDNTVKSCVNLTCEAGQLINPATNACGVPPVCTAGSRRVGSSWSCIPNPTCPNGSSFDTTTNQCRPDEAPCASGQVRDPVTRQCRPPDGCPTGQIRNSGGQCEAVQCPTGQMLDPVTNLCSDGKPTALPPTPFDALLAKIGAAITRVVALGSNKIPFGLASYFPSISAGSGCDQLDIVMPLGAPLGTVTLPICSNFVVLWLHTNVRPILVLIFSALGAVWIITKGLQS